MEKRLTVRASRSDKKHSAR